MVVLVGNIFTGAGRPVSAAHPDEELGSRSTIDPKILPGHGIMHLAPFWLQVGPGVV